MPVSGLRRYARLWQHIANPGEYLFHKKDRQHRDFQFTTRPLPIKFRVPNSLYLVFKEIFMTDVYEIDTLVRQLPAKPVIIDIGANVGFFGIQLLSKMDAATIYAYEPMPANVQMLRETMDRNPRLAQCLTLYQQAVTGNPLETVDLFAEAEESSQVVASVFFGFNDNNIHRLTVPAITLGDIIRQNNLQTIDLLKLDCEGSEYDIIYNTDSALIQRITRMAVEVHDLDTEQNNVGYFAAYLQQLGYQTTHAPINSFCHALEAVRV